MGMWTLDSRSSDLVYNYLSFKEIYLIDNITITANPYTGILFIRKKLKIEIYYYFLKSTNVDCSEVRN